MALTFDMLVKVHARATEKVNLIYRRPGGSTGYCYIDPKQPMLYNAKGGGSTWGTDIKHATQEELTQKQDIMFFSFYKQQSHARLMLKLKDVEFQNKNRESMLKLIYDAT